MSFAKRVLRSAVAGKMEDFAMDGYVACVPRRVLVPRICAPTVDTDAVICGGPLVTWVSLSGRWKWAVIGKVSKEYWIRLVFYLLLTIASSLSMPNIAAIGSID